MQFLTTSAGLTRFTLLSDQWHASNPTAANQLFGYKSWAETKQQIMDRFPELKADCDNHPPVIRKANESSMR